MKYYRTITNPMFIDEFVLRDFNKTRNSINISLTMPDQKSKYQTNVYMYGDKRHLID